MDSELNLPKPEAPNKNLNNPEVNSGEHGHEGFGSVSPELKVQPMPGEKIAQASSAVAYAVAPTVTPQPVGTTQASDDDDQTTSIADDNDVIEKEWVDKAKEIVARTQGDPHAKSQELNYLKKDYMSKRYSKIINIPKDDSLATN